MRSKQWNKGKTTQFQLLCQSQKPTVVSLHVSCCCSLFSSCGTLQRHNNRHAVGSGTNCCFNGIIFKTVRRTLCVFCCLLFLSSLCDWIVIWIHPGDKLHPTLSFLSFLLIDFRLKHLLYVCVDMCVCAVRFPVERVAEGCLRNLSLREGKWK